MRLTELAHNFLSLQLRHGDLAIDATAGNGHDSLKLAHLVGSDGRVIAIDIQSTAIAATRQRLADAGVLPRCELIENDHARALAELSELYAGRVAAITFNLGYLPGSNKSIQTTPESTRLALDAAARLLQPSGLLLVTAYRAHAGGLDESESVALWMREKQAQAEHVESHEPAACQRIPPILWKLTKTSRHTEALP